MAVQEKASGIWLHRFEDRDQAFRVIAERIDRLQRLNVTNLGARKLSL